VATAESKPAAAPIASRAAGVKPELLAPAGDRTCLVAAIENGADAVYFGLQGHNARARAANFDPDDLPEVMGLLHRRGVRGYVTRPSWKGSRRWSARSPPPGSTRSSSRISAWSG